MVVLWLGCCETENFANIWTNDSFIHFIPHSEIICLLVNKSFVFTDRHTKRLLNHFFIIWTCHFVYLFVYTCKVNKQTTGSKNEIQNSFFLVHINYVCSMSLFDQWRQRTFFVLSQKNNHHHYDLDHGNKNSFLHTLTHQQRQKNVNLIINIFSVLDK